jgi:DNA-binding transcriptional LysR family regulator
MKYAVEIAKTGSISHAARNLYMNQPNLSKSIKELENALNITLFLRTPKGVIPTEEAEPFLECANEILQKLDALETQIRDRKENHASFNISIPRATYITHAFTTFVQGIADTREIKLNYNETNTMETIDNLLYHHFDLGIIRYPVPCESEFQAMLTRNGLVWEEIWEFDYLLLMSEKNPLVARESICLSDLEEYTELSHGDLYVPFIPRHEYDQLTPSGSKARRIYLYERGSQFDLLRDVPSTYMWVSPLPPELLPEHGLVQLPCREPITRYKDVLIYRSDYVFSPYATRFVATLRQTKEKIEQDFTAHTGDKS